MDFRRGQETFLYSKRSRLTLRSTHSPMKWIVRNLSLGIKWLERESGTPYVLTVVSVLLEHCGKLLIALSYLSVHLSVVRMAEFGLP